VARAGRIPVLRHVILSVALWATYVLYWWIVVSRGLERDVRLAVGLLGLFIVLQVASTQAWILHNRRLARRHEGRRSRREAGPPAPGHDFLGRRILVWPEDTDLSRVPMVVVEIDDEKGEKRFSAGLGTGSGVAEASPPR
jgi:hypothetical protein